MDFRTRVQLPPTPLKFDKDQMTVLKALRHWFAAKPLIFIEFKDYYRIRHL